MELTDDELKADLQASESRGVIIHFMTLIEDLIDDFLALYFCGYDNSKKQDEFMRLMLLKSGVSLQLKVTTLNYIIINNFEEHERQYPLLRKDLIDIVEIRNIFAHTKYRPDLTGKDSNGKPKMVLFSQTTQKNKPKDLEIGFDKTSSLKYIDKMKTCFDGLLELYQKLSQ